MKYFISQPMRGRTDEEIKAEREDIAKACLEDDEDGLIIDSFFECAPVDAKPLWYLGESLKKLSEADIAYFAALAYGITVIEDNN